LHESVVKAVSYQLPLTAALFAHPATSTTTEPPASRFVTDSNQYNRTPLWGWVLILVALAMFVGMVIKALSTGQLGSR